MEIKPLNVLSARLSLAEALAFGSTVAIMMVFIFGTFQSKSEAQAIERRIEALEKQLVSMKDDLSHIRATSEYIKGRIEPKSREN